MFDLTSRLCLRCAQLWAGGFIQAEESTQELLWRWPGTLGWGASSCRMSLSCKHEAASLVLVKYCIYAMCLYTVGLGDQTESLLIVAWRDVWLGDLHSVLNNLFYLFIECYHSKHTELPSPRREAFYLRITSSACWFSTRWKEHLGHHSAGCTSLSLHYAENGWDFCFIPIYTNKDNNLGDKSRWHGAPPILLGWNVHVPLTTIIVYN